MFACSRLRFAAAWLLLPGAWCMAGALALSGALAQDIHSADATTPRPAQLTAEAENRAEALARVALALFASADDPDIALRQNLRALDLDPANAPLAQEVAGAMLERGEVPEALGVLKDSLKRNPQSARLALRIAGIYVVHLRKFDSAGRYAQSALAADPDLIECYQLLYSIYRATGRTSSATKLLEQAGQRTNQDAAFWAGLGDLWVRQLVMEGKLGAALDERALVYYRRAAGLARQDAAVLQRVLNFFFAGGHHEDAAACARRLLVLQPSDTPSREKLALTLAALGREAEAEAELETVAAENPTSLLAYRAHGEILLKREDFRGALAKFEKALALHDEDPRLYLELVDLCVKSDDLGRAAKWLAEARTKFARLPELPFYEGQVLGQMKRWREALNAFDLAADLAAQHRPTFLEDADFHFQRGVAAERVGEHDAAVQHFRHCLDLDAEHASALNYLGYMWAERGENLTEAESYIRRALQQEPDSAAFLDSLGWVLFQQGRYHEALAPLQRAIDLLAEPDATIAEHLGDTLEKLGRMTEAVKAWERAAAAPGASPALAAKLQAARDSLGLSAGEAKAAKP